MANNKISVFEHSKLYVGDLGFKDYHLEALVKYNDLHDNKFFIPGYNKITFKSYVGVIQVGDIVIEILPKADKLNSDKEEAVSKWQCALLYMLQRVSYIKLNETHKASQKEDAKNLLDIYIYDFLKKVEYLIHVGLVKKYRRIRENQSALKGRLLIQKQIQLNFIHKEYFFSEHNIYDTNNIFNSILKKALEIIKLTSTNSYIKTCAAKHLLSFENIDSWKGQDKDFSSIIFNRKTVSYKDPIELARMIILNFCPNFPAGNNQILAFLFDMNLLFEKFVYKTLKMEEANYSDFDLTVSFQISTAFWQDRTLRPDIIIAYTDKKKSQKTIIVDIKWKIIESNTPANDDLKQMYAYNMQLGSGRSILFYPLIDQTNSGTINYEKAAALPEFTHCCELYFSDLFLKETRKINPDFGKDFINHIIFG